MAWILGYQCDCKLPLKCIHPAIWSDPRLCVHPNIDPANFTQFLEDPFPKPPLVNNPNLQTTFLALILFLLFISVVMQCIIIYKKEKKEEMAAKEPKGEMAPFDISQMMNAPSGPFGSVHTI